MRHATFPDDYLRWVPRKRHNSRWPIEPKKKAGRMLGELQPLIEFEVPTKIELVDTTQQVDDKEMRNRSTRSPSRRISFAPMEGTPRKLQSIRLSPVKTMAPTLSPIKRHPLSLSPRKVADSPLRSFRVNATPTKVILESPKTTPPTKSPLKSSPAQVQSPSNEGTPGPAATPRLQDMEPLLFDQPTPTSAAEPLHEIRRRVSLNNARRNDRRSSGVSRLLDFELEREPPNRRHSLNLADKIQPDGKSRRSTLGVFVSTPDEDSDVSSPAPNAINATKKDENIPAPGPFSAVEVDVGTNLDIFGQTQKRMTPAITDEQPVSQDSMDCVTSASDTQCSIETPTTPGKTTSASVEAESSSQVMPSTPPAQNVIVETENESAEQDSLSLDQASASSSPMVSEDSMVSDTEKDEGNLSESPMDSATTSEQLDIDTEMQQQLAFEFEPHDPEGLSTIYEESTIMSSPAKNVTTSVAVERASSPVASSSPATALATETPVAETPSTPLSQDHLPGVKSSPSPSEAGNLSVQAANGDADEMSTPQAGTQEQETLDEITSGTSELQMSDAIEPMQVDGVPVSENAAEGSTDEAISEPVSTSNVLDAAEEPASSPDAESIPANHVAVTDHVLPASDSPKQAPTPAIVSPGLRHTENHEDQTVSLEAQGIASIEGSKVCDFVALDAPVENGLDISLSSNTAQSMELNASSNEENLAGNAMDTERSTGSEVPNDSVDSQASILTPERPATPRQESAMASTSLLAQQHTVDAASESPQSEGSGFTPINIRHISPPQASSTTPFKLNHSATESEAVETEFDDQDEVMLDNDDDEDSMAIDEDFTVDAPHPDNDTLTLFPASHDDSETEFVRKFVTRFTADKNAKAAATAAAAAAAASVETEEDNKADENQSTSHKRRSGSIGTTSSGSPIARSDSASTPLKRAPLSEKSPNSPSPLKKRKREEVEADVVDAVKEGKAKDMPSQDAEAGDAPKLKRRRKLGAPVASEPLPTEDDGPRRSTRTNRGRVPLNSGAPSANSVAQSLIPVRLPGGLVMDEESQMSMAARHRNEEKSLAAETRVNTRKNRGAAVLPKVLLAKQGEAKSVPAGQDTTALDTGKKNPSAKSVRWAEELVRYQGDDGSPSTAATAPFKSLAGSLLSDVLKSDADDIDELAGDAEPEQMAVDEDKPVKGKENVELASTKASAAKKPKATTTAPVRRTTRSTRLQVPTPIKKVTAAPKKAEKPEKTSVPPAAAVKAPAKALAKAPAKTVTAPKTLTKAAPKTAPKTASTRTVTTTTATKTTKASSSVVPKAKTSTSTTSTSASASTSTTSGSGPRSMATRRTKVTSLGMSANGTPAPKKRGRPAASASS